MQDDATLLRCFGETGSEAAFAELVRRHLDLVYSAALRQVAGDTHLAEDVAQSVFTDLARKASSVSRCPVLAGWLHTSTHYTAAKAVRTEQRRRAREREAQTMHELSNENPRDAEWSRVRPILDQAIRDLAAPDRDAILLRFFEGHAFATIGTRLALSENAARMRVERALDKLHAHLGRRGIKSTTSALAAVLVSQAVTAAPATLATSVANTALLSAASGGALVSLLQFMAITKSQAVIATVLLVAGGATIGLQQQEQLALEKEIVALRVNTPEVEQLRAENRNLAHLEREFEALRHTADQLPRLRSEYVAMRSRPKSVPPTQTTTATKTSNGGSTEPTYDLQQLDQIPIAKSRAAPRYPAEMRHAGISGSTLIEFVVDANGDVQDAHAVKSSHQELEAPAIEAIRQWKFNPGQKDGRPVNARQRVPIVFEMQVENPDWF